MNLNRVIIVGRITQAPELRNTPSGNSVCSFSVATNRVWKSRDGGGQETATEFHNIVAWRRLAEIAAQYLGKGSLVLVEGRLQTRSWNTPAGDKKWRTEIVADNLQLPPKSMGVAPSDNISQPAPKEQPQKQEDEIPIINEDEEEIAIEDIPF